MKPFDAVGGLKVFAGRNQVPLTQRVCEHLDIPFGRAKTDVFPDGEIIVRMVDDVRGRDCFAVVSTCAPVNENLMELLIFADTMRRASASRITAVIPYFGYARQDRKEQGRTPITAKLVANLITEAGFDRVLTIDLHAAQIQGFFDIPVDHLAATPVLYRRLAADAEHAENRADKLVVVSPDVGNVKVGNLFADHLGTGFAIIDKRRLSGDSVKTSHLIGDVTGKDVLMVDDMVSTGGTVLEAAKVLKDRGAGRITVAATHAVFAGPAIKRLASPEIDRVFVTDTIPEGDRLGPIRDKVEVLSVAKLLADAIHHIHHNQSVSALFRGFAETKR
jgi:ribose-phosphate pyrophosphokinase